MKYIFFDNNKENIDALLNEANKYSLSYPDLFKQCIFINEDILEIITNYNNFILVSPANSFGSMGGGLDFIINKYIFKDIQNDVMNIIKKNKNKFPYSYYFDGMNIKDRPYLPVGESFIIKADKKNYLAVVPTMEHPMIVEDTNNAYIAMNSLMKTLKNSSIDYKYVLIPCFCSGVGNMKPEETARQMIKALIENI